SDLDDEPLARRAEVDDERPAERMLPPKPRTADAPPAQLRPQESFARGRRLTELPSERNEGEERGSDVAKVHAPHAEKGVTASPYGGRSETAGATFSARACTFATALAREGSFRVNASHRF